MALYFQRIECLEELQRVVESLEVLDKKYVIEKKFEKKVNALNKREYEISVWIVEELQ
ncbi:hypothetical protein [Bacillus sp. XF8]|uniref:hypothetical protein n=1 Tax=Bacillus sp. XF8 TaxID=2819289 RepID=UPI001AA088A8|nr:hypothetical protein [Bacillus sp. XF8]MBO1583167.1 hypothetical protein [Bacillus sp. XF8]